MGEGLWGSAAPCIGTVGGQTKPKVTFTTHRLTRNSTHDSVYTRRMGMPPMVRSMHSVKFLLEQNNSSVTHVHKNYKTRVTPFAIACGGHANGRPGPARRVSGMGA